MPAGPSPGALLSLVCLETEGSASSSLTVVYVGVNQEGFSKKKKKRQVDTTQADFSLRRPSGLRKLFHDAAVKTFESCLCCQSLQMLLVSASQRQTVCLPVLPWLCGALLLGPSCRADLKQTCVSGTLEASQWGTQCVTAGCLSFGCCQ